MSDNQPDLEVQPYCWCGQLGKYLKRRGRREEWFCRTHMPAEIQAFQLTAFAVMQRGSRTRRKRLLAKKADQRKVA